MTHASLVSAIAVVLAAVGHASAADHPGHYRGEEFASQARVTLVMAEHVALKTRPGVIADRELEREAGGSGLRYSFDVKSGSKVYEVGIDAKTGKVLENDVEGSHPD